MAQKDYDRIANDMLANMPDDYKSDWVGFKAHVDHQ